MKIKICGLSREEDISYVNEAAPDYIGFVFAQKSRRCVTPFRAAALRKQLRPEIIPVGVFVCSPPESAAALYHEGIISMIQLHGGEDDEYIGKLRSLCTAPVIRAVNAGSVNAGALTRLSGAADYLLLDNGKGGTGESFDWSLLESLPSLPVPVFLAGGIGLHNIEAAACAALRNRAFFALDISSGAETNGIKDREKVLSLTRHVRRFMAENAGTT